MSHTKGPWQVIPFDISPKEYKCVQIGSDDMYATSALYPPDAHLISAAPELLEACKAAIQLICNTAIFPEHGSNHMDVIRELMSAIDKANGAA